jgi:hypothetical protein
MVLDEKVKRSEGQWAKRRMGETAKERNGEWANGRTGEAHVRTAGSMSSRRFLGHDETDWTHPASPPRLFAGAPIRRFAHSPPIASPMAICYMSTRYTYADVRI